MKTPLWRGLAWLALYAVLCLAPLLAAYAPPTPPARGFWVEFGVALGFLGLAMMGLQFVLTGRYRNIASSFGLDAMLQFHRQMGIAGTALVLAHPAVLIAAHPAYVAFFDPRVNLPRALALSAVVAALVLLLATTLWRRPLGLSYEVWRTAHGGLALLVVFVGLVHVLQVSYYVSVPWKQALWVVLTVGAMGMLVHARVVRPLRMRRKPWRVAEVRPEQGTSWTLVLEPEGHRGVRFEAGQFVWLTLGPTPFSLQQHPFSMSSSAEHEDRLELTIKAAGDFTERIGETPVGTRAFLEGPYGAFTLREGDRRGAVFVAGGVGITPVMSMLRTLRDRGDRRRLVLVYGNVSQEETLFWDELHALARELDLTYVPVLEEPPPDWDGERGRVTPEVLDRHLPPPEAPFDYYVCGPEPMMDVVEAHLLARGVPARRVFSERFQIV